MAPTEPDDDAFPGSRRQGRSRTDDSLTFRAHRSRNSWELRRRAGCSRWLEPRSLVWGASPRLGQRFWTTRVSLGVVHRHLVESLRTWVNDGLMTLFFFWSWAWRSCGNWLPGAARPTGGRTAGDRGRMAGCSFPRAYLAINASGPERRGWGIAMPTDIAFTLGVLAIATRNSPSGLRSFLLPLAIVDDILTIVVIGPSIRRRFGWHHWVSRRARRRDRCLGAIHVRFLRSTRRLALRSGSCCTRPALSPPWPACSTVSDPRRPVPAAVACEPGKRSGWRMRRWMSPILPTPTPESGSGSRGSLERRCRCSESRTPVLPWTTFKQGVWGGRWSAVTSAYSHSPTPAGVRRPLARRGIAADPARFTSGSSWPRGREGARDGLRYDRCSLSGGRFGTQMGLAHILRSAPRPALHGLDLRGRDSHSRTIRSSCRGRSSTCC